LFISYWLERVSKKKPTKTFTYGYKRFSLIAAVINSLVLLTGSLIILSQAVPRLFQPEHTNAQGMFFLSLIGILFNGLAFFKLKGGKNMNERTISWHFLEDVLGWVSIFIVSIIVMWKDIHLLDPILSLLFTIYILWGVIKNLKQTLMLFLQASPLNIGEIEKQLTGIKDIIAVHDTHAWSQDGEYHVISTHIIVQKGLSSDELIQLKLQAKKLLDRPNIHSTIEIEIVDEKCETTKKCG
jgi:cobalt-zinc-cadmium efflux system protein